MSEGGEQLLLDLMVRKMQNKLVSATCFLKLNGEPHQYVQRGRMTCDSTDSGNVPQTDSGNVPQRSKVEWSPLHVAVRDNQRDLVESLLRAGADPNERVPYYRDTALHIAASNGNAFLVKLLLEFGASPTICELRGKTPIELAVGRPHDAECLECVALLAKALHVQGTPQQRS